MNSTNNNMANTISLDNSRRFKDIMNGLKTAGKLALINIPVDLLAIDTTYQTDERTNRIAAIAKLAAKWDENKLEPIIVVPHTEECKFYVVNGYGRWTASQMQTPKYEYLASTVLLGALDLDPIERRKFESELFAYQNRETSKLTPIQIHGALRNLGDKRVLLMDKMQEKYGFTYVGDKGMRSKGVIGSYSELFDIADKGQEMCEYIFDICKYAAFDRKANGYSNYIFRSLRDMFNVFSAHREETKQVLTMFLRNYEPFNIKANAVAKYPQLEKRCACSMYLEDVVAETLGLPHARMVSGDKIVKIAG